MQLYRNVGGELDETRSKLVVLISVSLGLNLIVVVIMSVNYFLTDNKNYYSSIETCYKAVNKLVNQESKDSKKIEPELFNKSVLADFNKNKSKFNFKRVQLVKYLNSSSCEVVVKDKKGFRNYKISLESSHKFKHYFRVSDIQGIKITSRYQVTSLGGY